MPCIGARSLRPPARRLLIIGLFSVEVSNDLLFTMEDGIGFNNIAAN